MHPVLAALDSDRSELVLEPPFAGPGFWVGGPSALLHEGTWWLAYRLRRPVDKGRGYANVVARSDDGVRFTTVATVTSEAMGTASLERPALVVRPDGGWRLYVSCSTVNSKHWWVEALDADEPAKLADGRRTVVLPGSVDEAWKDVVVRYGHEGWQMWACRHALDGGDDEADRMSSWFATSDDGLVWDLQGQALGPGEVWDRRGARVTTVWDVEGGIEALYDGRASAAENWFERTGLATGKPDALAAVEGPVPASYGPALRYASAVDDGAGTRIYFERTRSDGAHDLRTVYVPRPSSVSQSV
ncbi:MAG: hypothetical protein JWO22_1392 [Frankiales bacterium]|nr:hypothetical protein [Frankiales bacterium]